MRLLVVEDEEKVANVIARGLRAERYAVDVAADGPTGWALASGMQHDLIILDLMLPGFNGTEVLSRYRTQGGRAPVLVLTARDSVDEKIQNLSAGADDYLTKPFALGELLVRVKALLPRSPTGNSEVLRVADLEINPARRLVRRAGKQIDLTTKEYTLLEYLARNAGRAVSRKMILDHVWDASFENLTNLVEVYVRFLRQKVDEPFAQKLIHTIRGVGYSLAEEPKAQPLGPTEMAAVPESRD